MPDWSKPVILALLLLALWLGLRAWLSARRAKRLERQREGLLRDIDVMQAALIPEVPANIGGLAVSVAYRPAEGPAAGGDFYDVFVPQQGRVAVVLGDVAGHGHDGLRDAALIRYTLRAYIAAGLEPRTVLALAGRALAQPDADEHFATVAVASYEAASGRLTYALAGHPPPLLHGFHAPEPVTACSSGPVGWSKPTGRRQTTIALPPGSRACFFSDGLAEARRGEELLGREGLSELLEALGSRPSATELLARIRRTHATPDDLAACILSPESTGRVERFHSEELEAGARELQSGGAARFLQACGVRGQELSRTLRRASDLAGGSQTVRVVVQSSAGHGPLVSVTRAAMLGSLAAMGPIEENAGGRAPAAARRRRAER